MTGKMLYPRGTSIVHAYEHWKMRLLLFSVVVIVMIGHLQFSLSFLEFIDWKRMSRLSATMREDKVHWMNNNNNSQKVTLPSKHLRDELHAMSWVNWCCCCVVQLLLLALGKLNGGANTKFMYFHITYQNRMCSSSFICAAIFSFLFICDIPFPLWRRVTIEKR